MIKLMMIAGGGGVGALLRYAVAGWAQKLGTGTFPVGTLVVNIAGCILIGILAGSFAGPHLVREEYRTALLVGFLGAFTTFSTFGWETTALINNGDFGFAALNVLLHNVLGLASVWLSYSITEKWIGV